MNKEGTVLAARNLRKVFSTAGGELVVLDGVELEAQRGEMIAVVGPSGSGKTTLLYLLAGLDRPTAGEVEFDGRRLSELSPEELAAHRNTRIGFVWQLSNLLPDFTAQENVEMPLLVRGESRERAADEARRWLAEVGLAERAHHLAGELSGGEQQRAALARALVSGPAVLFADEPTGNLDEANRERILSLLIALHRTHGLTSFLATHNLESAGRCDRVLRLDHGRLIPTRGSQPGES
ncbi:ABC transporter ATP-binding protein [Acidobacteriia bacterium AH_259_A11_L15]|nr:ABC transporter ATP-binding protein [Acidobacteriia bacterium AH_259_A11_L15]